MSVNTIKQQRSTITSSPYASATNRKPKQRKPQTAVSRRGTGGACNTNSALRHRAQRAVSVPTSLT